ncbi:hypothetical protein DPMN_174690 [Dreissena polymorpha]|uniref:Uncharacterized protein n=1 Tax=Dreissena polymorpha TaxID=45954 RepID=A0A9D4IFC7_DREPO|nr:hypothetical protein DPMN_174690 [Dreissena polymorpha]
MTAATTTMTTARVTPTPTPMYIIGAEEDPLTSLSLISSIPGVVLAMRIVDEVVMGVLSEFILSVVDGFIVSGAKVLDDDIFVVADVVDRMVMKVEVIIEIIEDVIDAVAFVVDASALCVEVCTYDDADVFNVVGPAVTDVMCASELGLLTVVVISDVAEVVDAVCIIVAVVVCASEFWIEECLPVVGSAVNVSVLRVVVIAELVAGVLVNVVFVVADVIGKIVVNEEVFGVADVDNADVLNAVDDAIVVSVFTAKR